MNARYFCVLGVVISIACAPKIEEEQVLEADLIFSSRIPEKEWIRVPADSIDRVFVDDNIACIVSGKEKKGHFFSDIIQFGFGGKNPVLLSIWVRNRGGLTAIFYEEPTSVANV